jgi:hypothetical protein
MDLQVPCPSFLANYPDLCQAVDRYCERTNAAFDAEPINALTNVGFLVAAWAAWRLQRRHRDHAPLISALIVNIAVIGLGSFAFHTLATPGAALLDVVPIVVFMLLYLWTIMTVFFRWSMAARILSMVAYLAFTAFLDLGDLLPFLRGGSKYLPAILVMIGIAGALLRSHAAAGRAFAAALTVFVVSFAMRSLDMPLCAGWPVGTHFLWHLLNALLLYLLVRLVILHGPAAKAAA